MKKFVVAVSFLLCLLFCSCSADTSGYKHELISNSWSAKFEGGAELKLEFNENTACLSIKNSDKKADIKGKYIADEKSFVIFVPEAAQNYSFTYVPNGKSLELSYSGSTVTLEREKKD